MDIKTYKGIVAELGCIICGSPASLHHPRFCVGMSQRENDWLVIPLCQYHHQGGPFGQAIHNGKNTFELNYGSEAKLLALTIKKIMEAVA